MRYNSLLSLSLLCFSLSACVTTSSSQPSLPAPEPVIASSPVDNTTNHFAFGNLTSSAWVSDSFTGDKSRQIKADTLYFNVTQTHPEGGLDVGLSRVDIDPSPVSDAIENLHVCSTYDINLSGEGRWWAGPKISVNWQGDEAAKRNGDDWYENYIVEVASSTPEELHDIFTGDYFKATVLPSTTVAGSPYKHYKIRFHSWWQFWSVRQDYRESGTLPIEPIVNVWIENGLPTSRLFDGVKANIETYGDIKGTGQLRVDISADPSHDLNCE